MTVAFTWNGLRALGVDEASLATFPEEFKQGMVARAQMLGDTGANHPDNWEGGLNSPDLHAIVILFARDEPARSQHQANIRQPEANSQEYRFFRPSTVADAAVHYAHDHFGYRDQISQPAIEGSGKEPTPGSGARSNLANSSSAMRTRWAFASSAATRNPDPQRQLYGLSPLAGACRQVPRVPARTRKDAGGTGIHCSETDGPLAQRRAAGPGTGR